MRIATLLPPKMAFIFLLTVAYCTSTRALPQTNQETDKPVLQENQQDEKNPNPPVKGGIQILSDTMGVDFGPYLKRLHYTVQLHWDPLIPAVAKAPFLKSGTVVIEFSILQPGLIAGMKIVSSSGDKELDKAAWNGVTSSLPLPKLPSQFKGDYLMLRVSFIYNPVNQPAKKDTQK